MSKAIRLALMTAVLGVAVPATAAEVAAEVNVYSARHYDTDAQLYEHFEAATGIAVNLIEAEADELIERIRAEGANSPADVLLTVDAGRLSRAQAAGILQPIHSPVLEAAIPPNLREPEGYWFGLAVRARVIYYNTANPGFDLAALTDYEDLADPVLAGKLCLRSSSNVYNQSLVGSLIAANGAEGTEQLLEGIVGNLQREPEGSDTSLIKAVAAGECGVTIGNTYYVVRLLTSENPEDRAAGEAVSIIFPNQDDRGTHVNISGAGVIATAPHPAEAQQFIEFLAGPDAQTLFAQASYEYPVLAGIAIDSTLAGLGEFKADSVNAAVFGASNGDALEMMDRAGWK